MPILVTAPLMVTLARDEQLENARSLISVTPTGIVTFGILLQFSNASIPMEVTVAGIVIVASAPQLRKAPFPIVSKFLRSVALVILSFSAKA